MVAGQLSDGTSSDQVLPVIREAARRWLDRQVRSRVLPVLVGGDVNEFARAVPDQRHRQGPRTGCLPHAQAENIDVNGRNRVQATYTTAR